MDEVTLFSKKYTYVPFLHLLLTINKSWAGSILKAQGVRGVRFSKDLTLAIALSVNCLRLLN